MVPIIVNDRRIDANCENDYVWIPYKFMVWSGSFIMGWRHDDHRDHAMAFDFFNTSLLICYFFGWVCDWIFLSRCFTIRGRDHHLVRGYSFCVLHITTHSFMGYFIDCVCCIYHLHGNQSLYSREKRCII